jgi:hypothetical protein
LEKHKPTIRSLVGQKFASISVFLGKTPGFMGKVVGSTAKLVHLLA